MLVVSDCSNFRAKRVSLDRWFLAVPGLECSNQGGGQRSWYLVGVQRRWEENAPPFRAQNYHPKGDNRDPRVCPFLWIGVRLQGRRPTPPIIHGRSLHHLQLSAKSLRRRCSHADRAHLVSVALKISLPFLFQERFFTAFSLVAHHICTTDQGPRLLPSSGLSTLSWLLWVTSPLRDSSIGTATPLDPTRSIVRSVDQGLPKRDVDP